MKTHTKWLATALAVASGLVMANPAQAQGVTGTPYLSNVSSGALNTPPSELYASWGTATISSIPTGLQISSSGYGSLYYVIPEADVQTVNPSATHAILTFTVNGSLAGYDWVGTPFSLGDNTGYVTYGGLYSGNGNGGNPSTVAWNGNTVTWTVPLDAAQLAAVQTGTDAIYTFGLQFDPASLGAAPYDITFNSLVVGVPVPEPSSLALIGLGAASLLAFRRRQ